MSESAQGYMGQSKRHGYKRIFDCRRNWVPDTFFIPQLWGLGWREGGRHQLLERGIYGNTQVGCKSWG